MYAKASVSIIQDIIITNVAAVNLRRVQILEESIELFYLQVIAIGFLIKCYQHKTLRTEQLITRLGIK